MSTATAGARTVKVAKDNYDQFKYALDNGLNAGIAARKARWTRHMIITEGL